MPRIKACGGREKAFGDFKTALDAGDGIAMLLVDAEDPPGAAGPWEHLRNRDGWDRPSGADDEHCHLMAQAASATPSFSSTRSRSRSPAARNTRMEAMAQRWLPVVPRMSP